MQHRIYPAACDPSTLIATPLVAAALSAAAAAIATAVVPATFVAATFTAAFLPMQAVVRDEYQQLVVQVHHFPKVCWLQRLFRASHAASRLATFAASTLGAAAAAILATRTSALATHTCGTALAASRSVQELVRQ